MGRRIHISGSGGYSLVELLLVVAVLGICLAVGTVSLTRGLRTQEARGAAQTWQAAAGWAQAGVLWHGGAVRLSYESGSLALSHDLGLCCGDLGAALSPVVAATNVARWRQGAAVAVTFSGDLGSPAGGGSLFFDSEQGGYRVVVRPESGLTVRTRVEVLP